MIPVERAYSILREISSQKVLKQAHRAPAVMVDQPQARTIGFMPTISAANVMLCGVFVIKDRDTTVPTWSQVCFIFNT